MGWSEQMCLVDQAFRTANGMDRCTITVGSRALDVLVAQTPQQRALGMTATEDADAMLFVMPTPTRAGFHMKGVDHPILIAFFDQQGVLIHADLMTPQTGRCYPPKMYTYALELMGTLLEASILSDLAKGMTLPS